MKNVQENKKGEVKFWKGVLTPLHTMKGSFCVFLVVIFETGLKNCSAKKSFCTTYSIRYCRMDIILSFGQSFYMYVKSKVFSWQYEVTKQKTNLGEINSCKSAVYFHADFLS